MSEQECDAWIERAETQGFEAAKVRIEASPEINRAVRDNGRVFVSDTQWAATLWERVAECVPRHIGGRRAHGLNALHRVYRYDRAQRFKWHFDGIFRRTEVEESRLPFMLYLNQGFEGGFTEFETFKAWPATGAALCFKHGLRHQGAEVMSGRKYVLRSDVMYWLG